jgi:hypothetical protein
MSLTASGAAAVLGSEESSVELANWSVGPDAAGSPPPGDSTLSQMVEDAQACADEMTQASTPAIAREIVLPDDLIRAIRESEIAIKCSGPGDSFAGKRIWLRRGGRRVRGARCRAADDRHRRRRQRL